MLSGALCCWTPASRGIIAHRGELMLPKVNDMLYMQLERSPEEATYKARVTELDDERIWMEVPLCEETGKFGLFAIGEELNVFAHGRAEMGPSRRTAAAMLACGSVPQRNDRAHSVHRANRPGSTASRGAESDHDEIRADCRIGPAEADPVLLRTQN